MCAPVRFNLVQRAPAPSFLITNFRVTTLGQPLEVVKVSTTELTTRGTRESKHSPSDSYRGNLLLMHHDNIPQLSSASSHTPQDGICRKHASPRPMSAAPMLKPCKANRAMADDQSSRMVITSRFPSTAWFTYSS